MHSRLHHMTNTHAAVVAVTVVVAGVLMVVVFSHKHIYTNKYT